MPDFDSFALQFTGATRAGLGATGADLIITESGIASGAPTLSGADLAALAAGGQTVLAYVNTSVTDASRSYWNADWVTPTNPSNGDIGAIATTAPAWLTGNLGGVEFDTANAGPDALIVDYRNADWRALVIAQAALQVQAGYGGVFLDDVSRYYEAGNSSGIYDPTLADAMMQLVIDVAIAVRAINPNAVIVVNSGVYIGGDSTGGTAGALFAQYRAAIDGVLIENQFNTGTNAVWTAAQSLYSTHTLIALESLARSPNVEALLNFATASGVLVQLAPDEGYDDAVRPPVLGTSAGEQVTGHATFINTMAGGDGNDSMLGGFANDTIYGQAGADFIMASSGNDSVFGGSENDTIYGGAGGDTIDGGTGSDRLFGGGEHDLLYGGAGDDLLDGGTDSSGNDTLYGADGNDTLLGGSGDNWLYGGAGHDRLESGSITSSILYGGLGNDYLSMFNAIGGGILYGDDGNDSLWGEDSGDILYGGAGNDVAGGGGGNDTLYGGAGQNTLAGGDDNDVLYGGDLADVLGGDEGDDTLLGSFGADSLQGYHGNDLLQGDDGNDSLVGGDGIDTLYGGTGDDWLNGSWWGGDGGNNLLFGGNGRDTLWGDASNDTLYGDGDNDVLYGGTFGSNSASHFLYGGHGNDRIYSKNYAEDFTLPYTIILDGGDGHDIIYNQGLNATIFGGSSGDRIFGGAYDDWVFGGADHDTLYGGAGNDQLIGDAGIDRLFGGQGNDILNGGEGNDSISGGHGRDVFVFNANAGRDRILDFQQGRDLVDLSAYDATWAEVRGALSLKGGIVRLNLADLGGTGWVDFAGQRSLVQFTAADFLL